MTADRRHALIIEDELLIGLGLQAQLSELGYGTFAFAGTELQALEQARLQCPHLVTVDVGLLDGDGVDAIDQVLRMCGPLPVIYVTGDGAGLARRRPEAVMVEKPVSDAALAFALAKAKARPAQPSLTPARWDAYQPYRPVT
jgi:two-component system, response regulator PdtaR